MKEYEIHVSYKVTVRAQDLATAVDVAKRTAPQTTGGGCGPTGSYSFTADKTSAVATHMFPIREFRHIDDPDYEETNH